VSLYFRHVEVAFRNRAGGIRTHDLLNPIQALYQAEPRPVSASRIQWNLGKGNRIFVAITGRWLSLLSGRLSLNLERHGRRLLDAEVRDQRKMV
jgi:hypothetical protein